MQTDYKEKSTITVDENDILKMSEKIQQNKRDDEHFSAQVDKFIEGRMPIFETLSLGATPNVLHLVGANADTLTMKQSVLRNSMLDEGHRTSKHSSGHDISKDIIKQLPEALRSPILIIKGQHPHTVVALTELKNKENKNILVPIALDLRSTDSIVNKVTSLYGKNDISHYLNKHQNDIIAVNKQKADELFTTIGYQLSKTTSAICYDNSISYSTQNVKHPEKNIQAEIKNSLNSDKSISDLETRPEYYSLSSQPNGKFGIFAISADGNITAVEPNIPTEKEAKSIFNAICENKSNIEVVPLSELRERSRSQLQAQSEKLPDVTYRIRNNLNADKTPDNSHAVIKMYRNENSDTYAIGEIMVKGSYDKCNQALAELLSEQDIKRDILSDLHADIGNDGNFKVNHEYYSSLPRSERAIEQFPADKALNIMQQLSDSGIEFSAVSRKNNMAAITVSKSDLDSFHKCAEKVLSVAQSNEEIENQNKSEIVSKLPDDMKSLYSIEQNGETRYYLNAGNSMRDLLETCSTDAPYAALMKCGEQISEERFANIQQGSNFAFSIDINFDEDSVSIYQVNGGISEIDRDESNTVWKSFKLSEITQNLTQTPDQQKASVSQEKINPDYYKQLKKDERSVIRLPHAAGDRVISDLQSAGIPFSAVKSEKLTSITVHKDNAQALDQIVGNNDRQAAKEYINSDFFKSLPPEERLYTQISGTDKANELMSELKNNNISFSAVVDKENNSAKVTVGKKDASALKKVTASLFSRKAQKEFSDKAKSVNSEHDTRNIAKNKDNQHSI